ncbi:MAG: hypothetical protein R2854_26255 [Caldilineaceae bacterium]
MLVAAAHHFWIGLSTTRTGSDRSNHFAYDVGWTKLRLLRYGDPPLVDVEAAAKLPDDYARFFPVNRIWRVRRGLLSASFYGDTTRLLTLTMGRAELASLKISQTYFGQYTGRFIGQEFTLDDGALTMPPGRPQPAASATNCRWGGSGQRRPAAHHARAALRRLPHPLTELRGTGAGDAAGHGFDLHLRTLDGTTGVTLQIALTSPGGIWEIWPPTPTAPGQVIFCRKATAPCVTATTSSASVRRPRPRHLAWCATPNLPRTTCAFC